MKNEMLYSVGEEFGLEREEVDKIIDHVQNTVRDLGKLTIIDSDGGFLFMSKLLILALEDISNSILKAHAHIEEEPEPKKKDLFEYKGDKGGVH